VVINKILPKNLRKILVDAIVCMAWMDLKTRLLPQPAAPTPPAPTARRTPSPLHQPDTQTGRIHSHLDPDPGGGGASRRGDRCLSRGKRPSPRSCLFCRGRLIWFRWLLGLSRRCQAPLPAACPCNLWATGSGPTPGAPLLAAAVSRCQGGLGPEASAKHLVHYFDIFLFLVRYSWCSLAL
jgi:hypothetical protein